MGSLQVFAAILATAALAGCAARAPEGLPEAPAPQAVVYAPYRLAGGDRLRIIVFGQADLTNSYAVDASGAISMPLIGRVRAQGLTTAELERTVAARLRQGYLRDRASRWKPRTSARSSSSAASPARENTRSSTA